MTIHKEKADRAIALIKKGSANADYFFEQLESPAWIEPLANAKLFSNPYPAVRRGEGLAFPTWVPGHYLARMATRAEAQADVVRILKSVPPSDNPRVYEVIADAAAALPADMAKQLVAQVIQGLDLPYQLSLPGKVASLIVHLADAGLSHEALRLARAVLAIVPQAPVADDVEGGETLRWSNREARGRISGWEYGEVLEQILKQLVQSAGMEAFDLFCGLLEEAVVAGRIGGGTGPEDFSYVWRTSIEHSDARRENVRDELVSAVRDAAEQIITASPEKLPTVIERLQARPTRVFRRIALFLLSRDVDQTAALAEQILTNPSEWDDPQFHPEYELLLARVFESLPVKTKQVFLEWIDKGPDVERHKSFRERMDGHAPEPSEVDLYRDSWTRDHLAVIASGLPSSYEERLKALQRAIGPAREIGRSLYRVSVGMRGERSPLSEDETLSLGWPALIAKARDWSPPTNDFDGPSVEGLANSIRQRVASSPHDAVENLDAAVDLEPAYISSILEALRESIKAKARLDWERVLTFIARVLDRAEASTDVVGRWRWVSKVAASLIDDSFDAGDASVPFQLRDDVWRLLERLAGHPDPTPEHEQEYGGSNMDPATLSLNTVRGEAFHAVVRYSLWVRRAFETLPNGAERIGRGFDELPEVRSLLDKHLDPNSDPSSAVRAVYGQWFPWLVLLDSTWATSRVTAIFPESPSMSTFFWAAWGTYIVLSNPYTTVLPILRPVYARAIELIEDGMTQRVGMGEQPSQHLADHLMAYYWRGELTLAENDLVRTFLAAADAELRGHALEWIGRILHQLEDPLSTDVEQRLTALWEWRVSVKPMAPEELSAFGWWFASGRLDQVWSLKVLEKLLSSTILPEPDHMVAERLAAIAEDYPDQAVTGLHWMVDLASEGWAIHGWLDSARRILEVGLKSRESSTRERATRIVHKMGALRFGDFRGLLNLVPPPIQDESKSQA